MLFPDIWYLPCSLTQRVICLTNHSHPNIEQPPRKYHSSLYTNQKHSYIRIFKETKLESSVFTYAEHIDLFFPPFILCICTIKTWYNTSHSSATIKCWPTAHSVWPVQVVQKKACSFGMATTLLQDVLCNMTIRQAQKDAFKCVKQHYNIKASITAGNMQQQTHTR